MFSRNQNRSGNAVGPWSNNTSSKDFYKHSRNNIENQPKRNSFGYKMLHKQRNAAQSLFMSKGNSIHPLELTNNIVENTEMSLNSTKTDAVYNDMEIIEAKPKCSWKSATDKKSGKTYYYNTITMTSTWEKPHELSTEIERLEKEAYKRRQKDFFLEMEKNIIINLSAGSIPGGFHPIEKTAPARTHSLKDKNALCPRDIFYAKAINHSQNLNISSNSVLRNNDKRRKASLIQDLGKDYHTSEAIPAVVSPDKVTALSINKVEWDNLLEEGNGLIEEEHFDKPFETIREMGGNIDASHIRRSKGTTLYSASCELGTQLTIKCICTAYRAHIIESMIQKYNNSLECSESFDDCRENNFSSINQSDHSHFSSLADKAILGLELDSLELAMEYDGTDVPSLKSIITFFTEVFTKSQMESDCIVMTLIYVERLIKRTNAWLRPTDKNWRALLLICIIMASKVWDDISMINSDFANICASIRYPITLQRINELELSMLQRLKFRVIVPTSEYVKYNIFVRSLVLKPEHKRRSSERLN